MPLVPHCCCQARPRFRARQQARDAGRVRDRLHHVSYSHWRGVRVRERATWGPRSPHCTWWSVSALRQPDFVAVITCSFACSVCRHRQLTHSHEPLLIRKLIGVPVAQIAAGMSCCPGCVAVLGSHRGVLHAACIAGSGHIVALTRTGLVYAWGRNDKRQLGLGDCEDDVVPAPTRVPRFPFPEAVEQVACGALAGVNCIVRVLSALCSRCGPRCSVCTGRR